MFQLTKWIRICFYNLFIVATLGVILRYKIAFSLPFVDQKHLLHGHSHFAFSGWITQIIMVLMVHQLSQKTQQNYFKKYNFLLWGNLITAYGMLITFPIQGYGLWSISFSTLSIINAYVFGFQFWMDLNKSKRSLNSYLWFKAAIVFNVISSIGAFSLAYLMATKSVSQTSYLLSVYGFLHFQYNGYFFFSITGLIVGIIEGASNNRKILNLSFWLFVIACIPAYFLSALWLNLPNILFLLVVLSALAQCVAWYYLFLEIKRSTIFSKSSILSKWILSLSAIALTIKIVLQLFSNIPSLSNVAFGFRPIVIGYLHLMLLGVITLGIIGYIINAELIKMRKIATKGLILFVVGIFINQLLLMLQGLYAIEYTGMPHISELLLFAAITMFTGLLLLNYGIINNED